MTALRRVGARLRRPDAVTLAVIAVTAVALALRLYDLGARAMHHDESLHAAFAWYFADGRGYSHDPLMHGPLQFHLLAALFKLFGDGDVMARLPAAVAGSALVAVPLLLRRWLGGPGTVITALMIAFSPVLLYFSRFARNDLLIALWTLLLVAAVWRYRQHGGMRWLVLLATVLALSFATKETAYLTVAILLLYLDVTLAVELAARRAASGWRRALETAALLPSAWLIAATWRPLASRLRLGERPREADLLVVLGTLTLPFLAAAAAFPVEALTGALDGDAEFRVGLVTVLLLLAGGAAVGLSWDWRRWAPLAVLYFAITMPLYTTGFTNLEGAGSGLWGSLDYWLAQQDVRRGTQPGFYYVMLLPLYEFLALLPALLGGAWLLWRGDRLARLLVWWFAGTFMALSLAGEKMPWLNVHLALPLALIAGRALGLALPAAMRRLRRHGASLASWAGASAAVAAGALLLALSLRAAFGVAYAHPDTPLEPLIYTQTSPEVPALLREIEAFADAGAGRDQLRITVDTTASFSWPWAWYLRGFPLAEFAGPQTIADLTAAEGIVIVADSTLSANPQLSARFADVRPYRHRWWFPEDGYRRTTLGGVLRGLRDGSLVADWIEFYAGRVDEAAVGSIDGAVLFPRQPAAQSPAGGVAP